MILERLKKAYEQVAIGNPLHAGVLMGPLIHEQAVHTMMQAIERAQSQGGGSSLGESESRWVRGTT